MEEEQQPESIQKYREPLLKDLPFLYIFGILTALSHFTVGIIYEKITITETQTTRFTFPYIGGYIVLVSIVFTLIFLYFLLLLRQEPNVPKYLRRFCLTLSILLLVAHSALIVILSIRANDFRTNRQQITDKEYGIALAATILNIIFSVFTLPLYFYIAFVNRKSLQLTPEQREQHEEQEVQERHTEERHSRREEHLEHEAEVRPQTNNRLHEIVQVRVTQGTGSGTNDGTQKTVTEGMACESALQNQNLKRQMLQSEMPEQEINNNP